MTSQAIPLFVVDAFSSAPFSGNPAAVCLLPARAAVAWMQKLAGEMNLSETAFVRPLDGAFELRWFTPAAEVDLCGHATLATAHVLWQEGALPVDAPAIFQTRSGELRATRVGDRIEMRFPRLEPIACDLPEELAAATRGTALSEVARLDRPTRRTYLIELTDESAVRELRPVLDHLQTPEDPSFAITAPADDPAVDFVSRYFAPGVGVPEDPVTGSVHCGLAPFWARKLGKDRLRAHQASRRGGDLELEVLADQVALLGVAQTVVRGTLAIALEKA